MRGAWLATLTLAACGGGAATPDAGVPDAAPDARVPCSGSACALICDPNDTWLALTRGLGTGTGDSEPASPDEVHDGEWHLFVGVNEGTGSTPDVYLYEATASTATATFVLAATALNHTRDSYDARGAETPAYVRADDHREYIYYCAITSYSAPAASIAALRRVDGGAWEKIGPVAPMRANEQTQCEPSVVRDAATGKIVLSYFSLYTVGPKLQEVVRESADPESFPSAYVAIESDGSAPFPSRLAVSYDPFALVWRTAYNVGLYPVAMQTMQTYSTTPVVGAGDLAAATVMHDANHSIHPELHNDGTTCAPNCYEGTVLQPSRAIYPNETDVIFYYTGLSNVPAFQINGQRCRRSP